MRLFAIAALAAMTPMVAVQAQQPKVAQKVSAKASATAKATGKTETRADRCKRAYKNYDAKTGRYRDAKGVSRPCTL